MKTLSRLVSLPFDTITSTIFLSRLPLWRLFPQSDPDFRKSAHTFALAGWIIAALPVALGATAYGLGLPASLTALVTLSAFILTTGALHEDGLADVADGFWGGHTRKRKLEIMRDSTVGTYGVLALFLVSAGRWAALVVLLELPLLWFALACSAVASISRFAMLLPWVWLPPARSAQDMSGETKSVAGLSARFGGPDAQSLFLGTILAIPALAILIWLNPVSLVFGLAGLLAITLLAKHHIGGHTGDVLGATQQLVELGLLFGLCVSMGAL